MIRDIIQHIRQRYQTRRDQRFLKKHHCDTWEQYHRNYDPDVWRGCDRVKDWYHGYPHVHCIDNQHHYAYKLLYDHGPGGYRYGYDDIWKWCKENCKNKYRPDIHRVMKNHWSDQWEMNELGGGDYVFFAFKDERDYMMFLLRWA